MAQPCCHWLLWAPKESAWFVGIRSGGGQAAVGQRAVATASAKCHGWAGVWFRPELGSETQPSGFRPPPASAEGPRVPLLSPVALAGVGLCLHQRPFHCQPWNRKPFRVDFLFPFFRFFVSFC